jgi:hypothetical protein
MWLAQRLGLDEADREVVYYASLLAWVGCHAYEQAKWFGDDTALKAAIRVGVADLAGEAAVAPLSRSMTGTRKGSPCSPRPGGSAPPY